MDYERVESKSFCMILVNFVKFNSKKGALPSASENLNGTRNGLQSSVSKTGTNNDHREVQGPIGHQVQVMPSQILTEHHEFKERLQQNDDIILNDRYTLVYTRCVEIFTKLLLCKFRQRFRHYFSPSDVL